MYQNMHNKDQVLGNCAHFERLWVEAWIIFILIAFIERDRHTEQMKRERGWKPMHCNAVKETA